jgi:hypothetical protein
VTSNLPRPRYDHLRRLTDAHGVFEHALGDEPRREGGYCTDDVARALVLTSLDESAPADLHGVYLDFTTACVAEAGDCHNRMAPSGAWTDAPSFGDWWGRALWALATAVTHDRGDSAARGALARMLERRSPFRRSMAYAALGASLVAGQSTAARLLLDDALTLLTSHDRDAIDQGAMGQDAIGGATTAAPAQPERGGSAVGSTARLWPEPRLAYDNALLPHALVVGAAAAGREDLMTVGLSQLEFLVRIQQVVGHLSLVPAGGRELRDAPPGYDQQPIEAAGLAMAGASCFALTGDERWRRLVGAAAGWFVGDNDVAAPMFDTETGAGYDGLTRTGPNLNRGAESTIAANLSLLQAHRLGVSACAPPFASTRSSTSNPILTG